MSHGLQFRDDEPRPLGVAGELLQQLVARPMRVVATGNGVDDFIVDHLAHELGMAAVEIGRAEYLRTALARRLAENGCDIDSLTIGELRCLIRDLAA